MDSIKQIFRAGLLVAGVAVAACGGNGKPECEPDCDGIDCGDDGCGGSCGICAGGQACEAGACVACEQGSVCPWPAEQTPQADNLTGVVGEDFYNELSGAVWNPSAGILWVCRNAGPSRIWALRRNPDGSFGVDTKNGDRGEWSGFGDLEGLTLADFSDAETLFLMVETEERIKEVDLSSYGTAVVVNDWDTRAYLPLDSLAGLGAEGITFVPDEFLQDQGFVDENGAAYTCTQGMGGIMLVAHQAGGRLYAFDLNRGDASFVYIGSYQTEKTESCGLEFDRSTGRLYIWHGDFNVLEVAQLSSQPGGDGRKLDTLWVYQGPDELRNYEGIAVVDKAECTDGGRSFFLTIDGGGENSLFHYARFPCE